MSDMGLTIRGGHVLSSQHAPPPEAQSKTDGSFCNMEWQTDEVSVHTLVSLWLRDAGFSTRDQFPIQGGKRADILAAGYGRSFLIEVKARLSSASEIAAAVRQAADYARSSGFFCFIAPIHLTGRPYDVRHLFCMAAQFNVGFLISNRWNGGFGLFLSDSYAFNYDKSNGKAHFSRNTTKFKISDGSKSHLTNGWGQG